MKFRPVLRWPGGKRRLLKSLLPLIPPHVCYVEAFAGGLAVLLAKEPSQVEIVNDANRDLVALYRCAQFHLDALCAEIEFLLSSRANIKDLQENRGLTDLQRAARFLMMNKMSFAGSGTSYAVQRTSGGGATFSRASVATTLRALNARLDCVSVECLDWERCVRLYDGPETFTFLDPPYLHAKVRAYAGWDEAQMTRLRDVLRELQGSWLLTVDGSDFCRSLFAEWCVREVFTKNNAVNNRLVKGAQFKELIITPHAVAG